MKICDCRNRSSHEGDVTTYTVQVLNEDSNEDEISYEVDLCEWHLKELASVLVEQFGLPADHLRITDQSGGEQ